MIKRDLLVLFLLFAIGVQAFLIYDMNGACDARAAVLERQRDEAMKAFDSMAKANKRNEGTIAENEAVIKKYESLVRAIIYLTKTAASPILNSWPAHQRHFKTPSFSSAIRQTAASTWWHAAGLMA